MCKLRKEAKMKLNCPHCTKEIELMIKNGISNGLSSQINPNSIQPVSSLNPVQQTPIMSRGAPIQSHGTTYYRDNDTGQVFVRPSSSSLQQNINLNPTQNTAQSNVSPVQTQQAQLNLNGQVTGNGVGIHESVKSNVANNPNNVDQDKVRSVAFGTPKPDNTAHDQKHKEAENILSRLASSDSK